jgi:hypothetical protein
MLGTRPFPPRRQKFYSGRKTCERGESRSKRLTEGSEPEGDDESQSALKRATKQALAVVYLSPIICDRRLLFFWIVLNLQST